MQKSTIVRTSAVGAVCALTGGAIGIAGSSASSPSKPNPQVTAADGPRAAGLRVAGAMPGFGPLSDGAGPPVHDDAVVPNNKGGFDTVTMDRGSFSSLSGDKLTITEGTKSATYQTVTLTIPSTATVRRNGEQAELSDLKAGDEVLVVQSPKGTLVGAHDAQHPGPLARKLRAQPGGDSPKPELPPPPGEGSSSESGEASPNAPEVAP